MLAPTIADTCSPVTPCDFILLQAFASLSLLHLALFIGVSQTPSSSMLLFQSLPNLLPNVSNVGYPVSYNTVSSHCDTAPQPLSMGV